MSWADYQQVAESRGDRSIPRLKYARGHLYLKMPTFEHGVLDELISDLVKALLRQQDRDCVATTPVTLKVPEQAGIEPDHCFWIENWQAVNGKKCIDLAQNPRPDIVIEVEVTSFTQVDDYQAFQIPEVWVIRDAQLALYSLTSSEYIPVEKSRFFPDTSVQALYREALQEIENGISSLRAVTRVLGRSGYQV
ncbi:MAG: Uma2 family endonuclease [Leptolyngbyaceae cyanobacterium SM2_3_12]|nr:Uma2 family endonuclease [Leptolyngbyaceae cyanobacterium SM2_3_12]